MKVTKPSSIAIVGMGRFGQTLYRLLGGDFNIVVWDSDPGVRRALRLKKGDVVAKSEKEVFAADVIFYAVPIRSFQRTLQAHVRFLEPRHLLIDTLSVKMYPAVAFKEVFSAKPGPRAILTHPMFGPDSSRNGFKGLPLVMDRFNSLPEEYRFWRDFFQKKGLRVVEMGPARHDRMAAGSQGVTHFVGRLLEEFDFQPTQIDTLGAKKLQELEGQVCRDTRELFLDLQNFNPYTRNMRVRLGKAYDRLYGKILPKQVERGTVTFGIQGGPGSFNEQALEEYIRQHKVGRHKIKYLFTSERVLRQLHEGLIDLGLFAMHNSVGGTVGESVAALTKYNCSIRAEFPVLIRHFLMRRRDNKLVEPGRVMAHDQVFKQCRTTLAERYPAAKLVTGKGDLADTARAARALAEGKLPRETFILGPASLSRMYDLEVVASDLQDNPQNHTTFLLVARP